MSASGSASVKRNANAVNPFRLAELRSIVGPSLDNASLANLLKRADGVIEKAVNFYFDNERIRTLAHSAYAPESKAVCSQKLNKVLNVQAQEPTECEGLGGTKRCSEMESQQTSPKMESVNASDESKWPKYLGTTNVMAYTTVDLGAEKMPGQTQVTVCRRISSAGRDAQVVSSKKANKSGIGSARRVDKRDYILRWRIGDEDSRECGRLPSEVSKPLAILLDAGWIEVDGCTLCAPDSSKKFANVPMALKIRMNCFSVTAASNETDSASHAPHEAMIRLLEILRYVPRIPSEVQISSESAAEIDFAISHECPKQVDASPHTLASDETDDKTDVDGEGGELSKEHVDILFNEADKLNWKLPEEPQPASMQTVLRDYQRQGLWWLRQREVKRVNKDDEREMLHPLWAEYRLPDDTPLYVKQIGSLVSLQRPMASSRGLGGILSDEMGLGKTLQLLALCSLDKPYSHRSIAGCEISAHVMSITSAVPEEVVGIDSSALTVEPHSDRMLVDGAETEIASGSRLKQKSEECIKLNQGLKRSADCISDVVDLTGEDVCSEIAGDGAEAEQKEQSGFRKINGSLRCNAFLDQRSSAHKLHSPSLQTRLMKKEEPKVLNGGTLVICPMSILGQWEDEIAAHLNPGHLRVAVHYGGDRTLSAHVLSRPDIVLTTYGVLSAEFVRLGQSNGRATLFAIEWHRIILDEAHYIKGRHTQVTQAVFALKGERRWAVTGTPVQNKLDDLYPLLRFIHLEPWSEVSFWQKHVIRPFEERKDVQALKQLHKALQPLLLRRTKESKDSSGNPILSLPPRTVEVVELDFSVEERDFYDALFTQSRTRFAAFVAAGKVMNNYASILEMLLRLRQCCAHPYLILSRSDVRSFDNPDLVRLALRLSSSPSSSSIVPDEATAQGLTRDLQDANVESAQECPICLESVEDPVVTPCAHVFCRECINDAIRRSSGTLCPNCRTPLSRSELISVPPPVNRCNFDAETNWRSSTKIDFLLQQLLSLNANESSELIKSVVFSQWTGMLDLVEIALRRAGIVFTRLDGSMSQQQRADNVATFSTSAKVSVLLISLKAGGVGINLTAASYVFLLDMWWNPAVDEQAIARVHRMGQTRPVVVRKLVIRDSVEQRVIQLQGMKKLLVQGALGMNKEEASALRMRDLHRLFGA